MNEPAAAVEPVDENAVPGADPELSLNPHQGHLIPSDDDEPKPDADKDDAKAADPPSAVEDLDEKDPADGLSKKVSELAYENRQLKRQLDERKATAEAAPEAIKVLKDFGYDEAKFNEYLVDETSTRTAAKMRSQGVDLSAHKAEDEFTARETAFDAENEGFSERLHAEDLKITTEMAAFIRDPDSEVGLHVGDYLSRNKSEASRIAAMTSTGQAREMLKLETKIGKQVAKASAEKTKVSKAPKPSPGIDGINPGLQVSPSDPGTADSMSDDEWLAARNKQLAK